MRHGFTLLELTGVLTLLALAASLSFPASRSVRERLAVIGAREELVGLIKRARAEALRGGGSTLIVVFLLKDLCAVYPGDLQHLLDMMRQPLIELIDDLAIDTDRDLNYGPGGVCHGSDRRYFFFALFFLDAAFLRLLFFAAARFAGFFPGAFSTAGFFAFEPGSEFRTRGTATVSAAGTVGLSLFEPALPSSSGEKSSTDNRCNTFS